MQISDWKPFPYQDKEYAYTGAALKKHWERLHKGDQADFPKDSVLQDAWRRFHDGEFALAVELGVSAGVNGYTVANKATCIYVHYLETDKESQLRLYEEAISR